MQSSFNEGDTISLSVPVLNSARSDARKKDKRFFDQPPKDGPRKVEHAPEKKMNPEIVG